MASLTPVNPCTYPNMLAAHQRGITTRFENLLHIMDEVDFPQALSDCAQLTQDGEAIAGTADASVVLPNWSASTVGAQLNSANATEERRPPSPRPNGVPLVDAKLADTTTRALVDTGASVSVVRLDFLLKAFGEKWVKDNVRVEKNAPYIMLGDGSTSATAGVASVPLTFNCDPSQTLIAQCWVFPKAAYDLILGAHFMHSYAINVRMGKRLFSFDGRGLKVPFAGTGQAVDIRPAPRVCAARDFWVGPGQEILVDATISCFPSQPDTAAWGLLAPDPTVLSPRAVLAHGPTRITADRKTKALVANFTDTASLIRVGTPLGFFTLAEPADFLSLQIAQGDAHFKKEVQEALDEAVAADTAADRQNPPMYFDQLASAKPRVSSGTPTLPASLDLSQAVCANKHSSVPNLTKVSRVHPGRRWNSGRGQRLRIPNRSSRGGAAPTYEGPTNSASSARGGRTTNAADAFQWSHTASFR
jgi:hypothetical protein